MNTERFNPPVHLSERAQDIWRSLVPENTRSLARLTLLTSALECLDLADRATAELDATPKLTTTTIGSGNLHQHPMVRVVKEARQQFAALWNQLGLHYCKDDSINYIYWLEQQKREEQEASSQ